MWDVNSSTGWYLSTDFIVSYEKGNLMDCTARGNIGHNFLRVKEGAIYFVKNFTVQPNKDDLCVLRFAHFIVEMDGETVIRRTTTTRSGSKTIDFHLANNRGQSVRVTLWGGLGKMLIEKCNRHVGLYPVVLTTLFVKLYNNSTGAKSRTLENLLMWARNWKYDIKTKKGWNYPSCGGEKCKKGNLDRKHGHFWCDSCHSSVDYPVLRYRLKLEVSDDTSQMVVVMFNETTRAVVKCSAGSIVGSDKHGALKEALDESGSSGTLAVIGEPKANLLVPLTTTSSVSTPSKSGEPKKARSKERHDCDGEESFVADSKTKGSDVGCLSGTRKRRRLMLDGSE
nr:hypothetical protein [Tanacetum cinerariifolium]